MNTTQPTHIIVTCEGCGQPHVGEYSHEGQFDQGPVYSVVCTSGDSWYEDNYTLDAHMSDYIVGTETGPMGIPLPVHVG